MFGSGVLDTIIGTCFVFLLVSVLVTIANELIAAALLSRAKWLQIGVGKLIGSDWAAKLYAHPLIEGSAPGADGRHGPSYIPSRAFANVLLDLVRQHGGSIQDAQHALRAALDGAPATSFDQCKSNVLAAALALQAKAPAGSPLYADLERMLDAPDWNAPAGAGTANVADAIVQVRRFIDAMPVRYLRQVLAELPNDKVRETLLVLLDDAQDDFDKFKANIEIWFNNAMDRVGGWYKRKSQWVIAALSIGAAVLVNVDAILIVKYLGNNSGVRDALVSEATAYAQNTSPDASPAALSGGASAAASLHAVKDELRHLALPIGWVGASSPAASDNYQIIPLGGYQSRLFDTVSFHLLGWLLTALAATLGAPFWFDMLNRFISIRSSGKAPEDRPKPPRDVPVPLEPGQSPREADLAIGRGASQS